MDKTKASPTAGHVLIRCYFHSKLRPKGLFFQWCNGCVCSICAMAELEGSGGTGMNERDHLSASPMVVKDHHHIPLYRYHQPLSLLFFLPGSR